MALHSAPVLQQFILTNVERVGKVLGRGSFGTVQEMRYDHAPCAGKIIHEMLVDPMNVGSERLISKFEQECKLLKELHHPHIVQFMGLAFFDDCKYPTIIMELLHTNIEQLLEKRDNKELPLSLKCSILRDTAKGLYHLHSHNPCIIHRDLTARNVLLTMSMVAKIADLGNAYIVPPQHLAQTMTRVPGTIPYMPPEAFRPNYPYTEKLDIFSFGHLSLYMMIQEEPYYELLPPTYFDSNEPAVIKGRSELERRQPYMNKLHLKFASSHDISSMIQCCLDNNPSSRPSASEIIKVFDKILREHKDDYDCMNRYDIHEKLREIQSKRDLRGFDAGGIFKWETVSSTIEKIKRGDALVLQLYKKKPGRFRKSVTKWKMHFFCYSSELFKCYTDLNKDPIHEISTAKIGSMRLLDGERQFEMKIKGKGEWILRAPCKEEALAWIEVLKHSDTTIQQHREAYETAIKKLLTVYIRVVRLNCIGLPRSGKTSFLLRLMKVIKNIFEARQKGQIPKEQPSTGVAESAGQVFIKKSLSCKVGAITSKEWSILKGLEEEGGMLIQWIYKAIESNSNTISTSYTPLTCDPSNLPKQPTGQESEIDSPQVKSPLTASEITSLPTEIASESKEETEIASESKEEDLIGEEILSLISHTVQNESTGVQKLLEDMILLINTDAGGQAEFLDLHASLVDGPSLNLLFHRLQDDLDRVFETYYTNESGDSTKKALSTLTVEEVLFQALSSIACFSGCFLEDEEKPCEEASVQIQASKSKSKVMFVGTHRDMVPSEDDFLCKDRILKEKIECTEFFNEKDIIKYASDGQLMLSINNLHGDEDELDPIQKKLEEVIEDNFEKIQIPIPWLLLSLYIRSKKWRTLSLAKCEKLAGYLGICSKDLQHVLWFFHHCIGVHLYYPEIMKDTLICDIQVVFDGATNLIKHTFKSEWARKQFKENGRFSLKDLKDATSDCTDDLIPLERLVKLLEYLGMLTVIPSAGNQEPTYFMPCVLKSARASEQEVSSCSESDPAHLMLRFDCGYMPMGIFPAMITNLVSQQWEDWRLIEEGLHKNKIQFLVGDNYDTVSLLSHPRFIEIAINLLMPSQSSKITESLCVHVRNVVECILENVTKRIHRKFGMGYRFGFHCPIHPEKDHLCILEKKTVQVMLCLQNPKHKRPVPLNKPQHRVWFPKQDAVLDPPTAATCPGRNYTDDHSSPQSIWPHIHPQCDVSFPILYDKEITQLKLNFMEWRKNGKERKLCLKEEMSVKWKEMGQNLGIGDAKLEGFQGKHLGDIHKCMDSVITEWIRTTSDRYPATWAGLMKLLRSVNLNNLASTIEEAADEGSTHNEK